MPLKIRLQNFGPKTAWCHALTSLGQVPDAPPSLTTRSCSEEKKCLELFACSDVEAPFSLESENEIEIVVAAASAAPPNCGCVVFSFFHRQRFAFQRIINGCHGSMNFQLSFKALRTL